MIWLEFWSVNIRTLVFFAIPYLPLADMRAISACLQLHLVTNKHNLHSGGVLRVKGYLESVS